MKLSEENGKKMLPEKISATVIINLKLVLQQIHWSLPYDHFFPAYWMFAYWLNEPEVNKRLPLANCSIPL
jgi:hypothetical protein